jgi:translocation protein SEC62
MAQVESFIPGWDWDLPPKKKTRKSKKGATESAEGSGAESSSKKSKLEPRPKATGGATIEEVADEGDD